MQTSLQLKHASLLHHMSTHYTGYWEKCCDPARRFGRDGVLDVHLKKGPDNSQINPEIQFSKIRYCISIGHNKM